MNVTQQTYDLSTVTFDVWQSDSENPVKVVVRDYLAMHLRREGEVTLVTAQERLSSWIKKGQLFPACIKQDEALILNGRHVAAFKEVSREPWQDIVITVRHGRAMQQQVLSKLEGGRETPYHLRSEGSHE